MPDVDALLPIGIADGHQSAGVSIALSGGVDLQLDTEKAVSAAVEDGSPFVAVALDALLADFIASLAATGVIVIIQVVQLVIRPNRPQLEQ